MKIVETRKSKNEKESIEIKVDGVSRFSVRDGDEEDNRLSCHNFEDCYAVSELMKKAYNAGKNGEEFDYILHEEGY